LVVANRTGRRVYFFENHGRYSHNWRSVAARREPLQRHLLEWITGHPGCTQGEVVAEAGAFGVSRGTALRRINRLLSAGLVTVQKEGRALRYFGVIDSGPSDNKTR
jgi:DNA-binding transcriptional ArsR family regulator